MLTGVIGINFKTSTLINRENLAAIIEKLKNSLTLSGSIVLSTCNRIEIYFSSDCLASKHSEILDAILHHIKDDITHEFYTYFSYECFYHLSKVASGLDSAIFGESEIQRQVKLSYLEAKERHYIDKDLHYIFQKALHIGKQLRSKGIEKYNKDTLEQIIYKNISLNLKDKKARVLFVGNSQINRKILSYFQRNTSFELSLCSKNVHQHENVGFYPRENLKDVSLFDIIICGAKTNVPLVSNSTLFSSDRKTLIFDLGVPRNVSLDCDRKDVFVMHLDHLQNEIIAEKELSILKRKRFDQELEEYVKRNFSHYKLKATRLDLFCKASSCVL